MGSAQIITKLLADPPGALFDSSCENALKTVLQSKVQTSNSPVELFAVSNASPTKYLLHCMEQQPEQFAEDLALAQRPAVQLNLELKDYVPSNNSLPEQAKHLIATITEQLRTFSGDCDQTNRTLITQFNQLLRLPLAENHLAFFGLCFDKFIKKCLEDKKHLYANDLNANLLAHLKLQLGLKTPYTPEEFVTEYKTLVHLQQQITSSASVYAYLSQLEKLYGLYLKASLEDKTKLQYTINGLKEQKDLLLQLLNRTTLPFISTEANENSGQLAINHHLDLINILLTPLCTEFRHEMETLSYKLQRLYKASTGTSSHYELKDTVALLENLLVRVNKITSMHEFVDYFSFLVSRYLKLVEKADLNQSQHYRARSLLSSFIQSAHYSFPHSKIIQKAYLDSFHSDLCLSISQYRNKRLVNPTFIEKLFDRFFRRGAYDRKRKNSFDSRSQRNEDSQRLRQQLKSCKSNEDYLPFIARCLLVLRNINSRDSRFRRVVHSLISRIITEKLLVTGTPSQLMQCYQLLKGELRENAKPLLDAIEKKLPEAASIDLTALGQNHQQLLNYTLGTEEKLKITSKDFDEVIANNPPLHSF